MSRWTHIRSAPPVVYAFIASAALHLGAIYGAGRVMSAPQAASMPSVEFRAGDHAIEVRLIPMALPAPVEVDPVIVEAPAEKPVINSPTDLRESEQVAAVESDAAGSMIQDAGSAQAAADQTGRRIAQIVVVEARKAVGRLKDMLDSAPEPVDVAEPVATRPIAKPKVVPPKTPPKIVPPVVVKPPEAELSPELAPAGRSGVTHGASLLNLPTPHYPLASRRRGEEGLVTLRVRVLADGRVGAAEIVSGPRFERLRRAALDAIRRARFAPAVRNGKAIASSVIVPIRFKLR